MRRKNDSTKSTTKDSSKKNSTTRLRKLNSINLLILKVITGEDPDIRCAEKMMEREDILHDISQLRHALARRMSDWAVQLSEPLRQARESLSHLRPIEQHILTREGLSQQSQDFLVLMDMGAGCNYDEMTPKLSKKGRRLQDMLSSCSSPTEEKILKREAVEPVIESMDLIIESMSPIIQSMSPIIQSMCPIIESMDPIDTRPEHSSERLGFDEIPLHLPKTSPSIQFKEEEDEKEEEEEEGEGEGEGRAYRNAQEEDETRPQQVRIFSSPKRTLPTQRDYLDQLTKPPKILVGSNPQKFII